MKEICSKCNVVDDKNHRLNDCPIYRNINLLDSQEKIDFSNIYSTDMNVLRTMIKCINKVWDVTYAHGNMRSVQTNWWLTLVIEYL